MIDQVSLGNAEDNLRSVLDRLRRVERAIDLLAATGYDEPTIRDVTAQFGQVAILTGCLDSIVSDMAVRAGAKASKLVSTRAVSAASLAPIRALSAVIGRKVHTALAPSGVAAYNAPERNNPTIGSLDVLIVDNDADVLRILEQRLKKEGHRVYRADGAATALAICRRGLPDVLVIDLGLPEGSAHDVIRHVREARGGSAPLIIVFGFCAGFAERIEAARSGADAYVEKPVDIDDLVLRIQDFAQFARTPTRILYVEDDPIHAARVKLLLQKAGMEAHVCSDPRQFETLAAASQPDAMILDVSLPGISGIELTRYLRLDARYALLPVIVVTADASAETRAAAAGSGADDYLVKPVTPELLLSALRSRIARARAVRGQIQHDGLTRLLTQVAFRERLERDVRRLERETGRSSALVMLDIDHFKQVNDKYGHPTGDRVIAALAALLRSRVRKSDALARYGGEEFGMSIDRITAADAIRFLRKLLEEFGQIEHRSSSGEAFRVTFSAGIAMFRPGMSATTWLAAADRCLYAAKEAGRNTVRLSD